MAESKTRCSVSARVTLTLTVEAGPFGGEWKLDAVRKDALESARATTSRLIGIAREKGIDLRVESVDRAVSVSFEPEER